MTTAKLDVFAGVEVERSSSKAHRTRPLEELDDAAAPSVFDACGDRGADVLDERQRGSGAEVHAVFRALTGAAGAIGAVVAAVGPSSAARRTS